MAEQQPRRKVLSHPRVSRSPSPAHKPAFRHTASLLKDEDLAPLWLSWPGYRWVVRLLMVVCLYQCAVVYALSHDLAYQHGEMQLAEALTVGLVVVVCMGKMWHRKRLPRFLIWVFVVLLIYLYFSVSSASNIYEIDRKLKDEELQLEKLQEQEQSNRMEQLKQMEEHLQLEKQQQLEQLRHIEHLKQLKQQVQVEHHFSLFTNSGLLTTGNVVWYLIGLCLQIGLI